MEVKVKKTTAVYVFVVLAAVFASTAKADNPANVTFYLEVEKPNTSAYWDSSPICIDLGYTQYDYTWELTQIDLMLEGQQWYSILSYLTPSEKSSGTAGSLPFVIIDDHFGSEGIITLDGYVTWTHLVTGTSRLLT